MPPDSGDNQRTTSEDGAELLRQYHSRLFDSREKAIYRTIVSDKSGKIQDIRKIIKSRLYDLLVSALDSDTDIISELMALTSGDETQDNDAAHSAYVALTPLAGEVVTAVLEMMHDAAGESDNEANKLIVQGFTAIIAHPLLQHISTLIAMSGYILGQVLAKRDVSLEVEKETLPPSKARMIEKAIRRTQRHAEKLLFAGARFFDDSDYEDGGIPDDLLLEEDDDDLLLSDDEIETDSDPEVLLGDD